MRNINLSLFVLLALISGMVEPVLADDPTTMQIPFSSNLRVQGEIFDGTAGMKVVLLNPLGQTIWSNDLTSVDGAEPTGAFPVAVDHGNFSVILGGSVMAPIPITAFDTPGEVLVKIWIDAGNGFQSFATFPLYDVTRAANAYRLNGHPASDYLTTASVITIGNGNITEPISSANLEAFSDSNNSFTLGDGTDGTSKLIIASTSAPIDPALRFNATTSKWEFSNDGVTFNEMASSVATGFIGSGSVTTAVDLDSAEVSGVLGITKGGTGASSIPGAQEALGLLVGEDVAAYVKDNLTAVAAPSAADDSTQGYTVGSHWIDTASQEGYVALDVTPSAAVWRSITSVGTSAITDGSVEAADLAADAVTTDKILDGTITADDIASDTIAAADIAPDAIGSSELASTAVSAGSYTLASITVDADGRITAASSGSASSADIESVGDASTGAAFANDVNNGSALTYEGSVVDTNQTTLAFSGEPAADNILLIPNTSGTLVTTGDTGSVDSTMIANGAIAGSDLANDSIDSAQIAADAVDSSEIAANAVGASEIASSGVAAGSYTLSSITVDADGRITAASSGSAPTADVTSVGDGTSGDIFTDGVNNGTKLVYEGSVVDGNQTTLTFAGEPAADNVITIPNVTGTLLTTADSGVVDSTIILNDTIANTDINSAAGISFSKLASLSAGNILLGNVSNVATGTAISGDATLDNAGALTIANNSVDGTDIALGSDAQGDIMYYDGTDWVRLAAGTAGRVLQTNGAAANPSWVASGTGTAPHAVLNRRMGVAQPLTTTGTTFTNYGMSAFGAASGTATAQAALGAANRMYLRWATGAVLNNTGGITAGPFLETRGGFAPKFTAIIRTDSAITTRRIYAGLSEATIATLVTNTAGTTASTTDFMAIGYDTNGNGNTTDWLCCSGDGTDYSCVTTGVTVAVSTEYTISVDYSAGSPLVCTVNGTSVSKATNLPGAAANLGVYNAVTTLSAAIVNHFAAKMALEQN